jgi:hypothetical protein
VKNKGWVSRQCNINFLWILTLTLIDSNQGNYFKNVTACNKITLKTTVVTQLYLVFFVRKWQHKCPRKCRNTDKYFDSMTDKTIASYPRCCCCCRCCWSFWGDIPQQFSWLDKQPIRYLELPSIEFPMNSKKSFVKNLRDLLKIIKLQ